MKCSQAHKRISEYIDGLLDESAIHQLETHLETCENCTSLLAEMKSFVNQAKRLVPVQPSENVWLSIRKGLIRKEHQTETKQLQFGALFHFIKTARGLAIASSALLVIIISTVVFYYHIPVLTNDPNDSIKVAQHHFEEAEKHYQMAIKSLNKELTDYEAKLPPDLLTVFNENLEIIDQSIKVCRAAIREHPENEAVNALLMACYKKKVELLNEIRNLAMQAG